MLGQVLVTWIVLRMIWEAKGYSTKEMPAKLKAQWPKREGLSFTSINRKARQNSEAPEDVFEFLMDAKRFPIREGHEEAFEVVRLGVAALQNGAVADPEKLAAMIAAKVPTLEPEVIAQAVASKRLRFPMRRLALKVADALRDQLDAIKARLEEAAARRETDKQEITSEVRAARRSMHWLTFAVLAVGFLGGGALYSRPSGSATAPEAARAPGGLPTLPAATPPSAPAQRIIVLTNVAQSGAPLAFDLQALLGAVTGQVGEKVVDQPIPGQLLPGQKLPPCLGEAGEVALNGGCWTWIAAVKPPCGRYLFRNGDRCYRPVAADPTKPVGLPTLRPALASPIQSGVQSVPMLGQESHGTAPAGDMTRLLVTGASEDRRPLPANPGPAKGLGEGEGWPNPAILPTSLGHEVKDREQGAAQGL